MTNYKILNQQLTALIEDEPNIIANLSNAAALLFTTLKDINWAGFYILDEETLILGPFQGNPACVRIKVGSGVCGTAIEKGTTMRVEDVNQFDGHIACDANSKSEIVIPIKGKNGFYGVLDIDAPITKRFSEEDQRGLETFVDLLEQHLKF
ncbi:GAF domain-containing protein [Staphylococcus massiliensis]|uniref:GAF domain-containing protein n=1 Tax=Staphylococcus massiliensis S46 TaxID=1229783 RepID=K9B8W6_9STAP|nr:GAF domain-containing protein [Staphylococcus massiliensis]EKU50225.1 hypothetical protein C273_01235 [Staphylococcus massiliensis S46]PNZ99994.1 GAF domain-containing protein [Staphylococcus massiliensis CCUG 55927]